MYGRNQILGGYMKLITYQELGKELCLSTRYLVKCVQEEGLPCIRFGRAVRFEMSKVVEWVNNRNQNMVIKKRRGVYNES